MILCDNSYGDWLQYSDYDMHKQDMHNNILKRWSPQYEYEVWTTKEKYLMQQSNDGEDSWLGVWEVVQKNMYAYIL